MAPAQSWCASARSWCGCGPSESPLAEQAPTVRPVRVLFFSDDLRRRVRRQAVHARDGNHLAAQALELAVRRLEVGVVPQLAVDAQVVRASLVDSRELVQGLNSRAEVLVDLLAVAFFD